MMLLRMLRRHESTSAAAAAVESFCRINLPSVFGISDVMCCDVWLEATEAAGDDDN